MFLKNKKQYKDNKKRSFVNYYESKRIALKAHVGLKNLNKINSFIYLDKLKKSASETKIHNRCIITGRAHAVYSKNFKISRILVKNLVSKGLLPGVKKASW